MTMLTALASYYNRLAMKGEVPPFGYARTRVAFCIIIDSSGRPSKPVDLRSKSGKKLISPRLNLPTPLVQRTSGIAPNFLWDKTAYALGVTAGPSKRTGEEHSEFVRFHKIRLSSSDDEGLIALRKFLDTWKPDEFYSLGWPSEMVDENVIFALDTEYRDRFIHQRSAAHAMWSDIQASEPAATAICLVTGRPARIARSHPPIKGVRGAQSSGAFVVSANASAFVSYASPAGDNAPVSEEAAFAYTTVLNLRLESLSENRVQIGDTSTVFWADGTDADKLALAEDVFAAALGGVDDSMQVNKALPVVEAIAAGRPLAEFDAGLAEKVRFHVLGLSPNAARLSVRFWFEEPFGRFADNLGRHAADLRLDPPPKETLPGVWRLLVETAVLRKRENVPPQLAGELLRAILAGGRYPATLLSTLLMRLRADGDVNALRVAMLKAIVARSRRLDASPTTEEPPVSLDPDCKEPGYLLGRLFAEYERAQSAALGRNVNATVKDKYYGAASSTPQTVFPLLDRGAAPHIAKLRKQKPGMAVNLEKAIAGVMEQMSPRGNPFPRALQPDQQALFALGYYHQRQKYFETKVDAATAEEGTN